MSHHTPDSPEPAGAFPPGWAPVQSNRSGPPRNSKIKLAVGLVVVFAVVAVGAVLLFNEHGPPNDAQAGADGSAQSAFTMATRTPPPLPATIASADDTGPITIITDDTTCGVWDNVQTAVSVARNLGWAHRDASLPASAWDSGQRAELRAFSDSLRTAADASIPLAARTPHRAMRELYEAFIAYGRAYTDALPNYQPTDDFLGQTSLAALDAITNICAANRTKVASVEAPSLAAVQPPTAPPSAGDLANPQRFLAQTIPACTQWVQDTTTLEERTQQWAAMDPNVGVGQLNREQVLAYGDAAQTFTAQADTMLAAGRGSGNTVLDDLASLGALYFRAYANAVPLIWVGDHDLAEVGFAVNNLMATACQADPG